MEEHDACVLSLMDGLEDVFCHRHRCQGEVLPPHGTRVSFKLHLSAKVVVVRRWKMGMGGER